MKMFLLNHRRLVKWVTFVIYTVSAFFLIPNIITTFIVIHFALGLIIAFYDEWCESCDDEGTDTIPSGIELIMSIAFCVMSGVLGPTLIVVLDLLEHRRAKTAGGITTTADHRSDN